MGNSSSSDKLKLTDAETTAVKHFNSRDFASLMKLLEQEPVDLFKLVSFNEDNPENIKNGYDFIHTLLCVDHQPSSTVSILKAFKQTIESNKQKNSTTPGSIERKPFRETPQFDKFPYSYLQFVIFNNPQDLESFIFLLDNKETFPSPPPASQSLVHDLCSNPRAIELLRHLISSGEFPERFKNSSSSNNLDEQMRGSANSVVIEQHRSFTPLQAACAAVNKLAVQELCVAGLGGSNYGECAETLLTTAIAGEQDHNLGSMVLFKKENQPQEVCADDVSDILLCLLAQPNADNIRKHRLQLSSIQSQKARNKVVAVFKSHFDFSPETLNLMHLAFAFYDGIRKNTSNDSINAKSNSSSGDNFLKTALDNNLAVCATEELTLSSEGWFRACTKRGEIENVLAMIGKYRLGQWLITSKQRFDLSAYSQLVDDETLRLISPAFPSLQSLKFRACTLITDNGLHHLAQLSFLQSLSFNSCSKITDSGLEHLAKLSSLLSLDLYSCKNITDSGLQHLVKLSSLETLNLYKCEKITDTGLQPLSNLASLQYLNLYDVKLITDTGLEHLSKVSSLRSLNLNSCDKITDNGLQHLATLSSLRSLDLSFCKLITDNGLQHLAQLPILQSLNLTYCDKITDSGLQHLVTLSSLQSLYLAACGKISDSGLRHLAKLSSLQRLTLEKCKLLTDTGLEHLAKLSSLQSLNVESCNKITDSGIRQLTTKLPSTNIHS